MKTLNNTVEVVNKKRLCTACGACAGICHKNAISMEINEYGIFTPKILAELCNRCGLCLKVCPGHEFNYVYFSNKIYGGLPENAALGHYLDCYAGQTNDPEILKLSQSGGFVSTFLVYCINKKICNGAVVTRWNKDKPFEPEIYIAETREEVLESVGSKYNPIPVAMIIKELLKKEGKYIFVGTSCQVQGMRKAEEIYPKLKEKIILYIGLHCLKVFNYHYHNQILHKIKQKKENIKFFRFRDKAWRGWPCDMRLITKDDQIYDLPGDFSRLWARSYFSNWRCQLCFDKVDEFADISCGDCRIDPQKGKADFWNEHNRVRGLSDIVIRSKRGEQIFNAFVEEKLFSLEKTNPDDVAKTIAIAEKKLGINDYEVFTKIFNLGFPSYGVKFLYQKRNSLKDIICYPYSVIACLHYYLCHVLIKYSIVRFVFKLLPHKLFGIIETYRERFVNHVRYRRATEITIKVKEKK